MPIGFDDPYIGLMAGYFANRGPGRSALGALGSGMLMASQMQQGRQQDLLAQKREQRASEAHDAQIKALRDEMKRTKANEQAEEELAEFMSTHAPAEQRELVSRLNAAGHTQAAMMLSGLMPKTKKEPKRWTTDELKALAARQLANDNPDDDAEAKSILASLNPQAGPFGKDSMLADANNIMHAYTLKKQQGLSISAEEELAAKSAYHFLTNPQQHWGPGGSFATYTPGSAYPAPSAGGTPVIAPGAAPPISAQAGSTVEMSQPGNVTPAPGTAPLSVPAPIGTAGTLTTIRGPAEKMTGEIGKAKRGIEQAREAKKAVQRIRGMLEQYGGNVTGFVGDFRRYVLEGFVPQVRELFTGDPGITETPASDFESGMIGLQGQMREPFTGPGNTNQREWERLQAALRGLDWKDSSVATMSALDLMDEYIESSIRKNENFIGDEGGRVPKVQGVTPEMDAVVRSLEAGEITREEAKRRLRALGATD